MVVEGLGQQLAGAGEGAPVGQAVRPLLGIEGQAESLGMIEAAEQGLLPVQLFTVQGLPLPDGLNRLHLLLLGQIEAAPLSLGRRHRLVQDAAEQGVEAVFGRQRQTHVHEIAEGQSHAGHGAGEIVYLADRRVWPLALAEVEVLDPLGLLRQCQQGGGGAPRHQPDDGQQQQQTRQGPDQVAQGVVAGRCSEFVRRYQQGQVEGRPLVEGGEVDQPVAAILGSQRQLGWLVQQGGSGCHLLLQLGQYGLLERRQHGQPAQLIEAGQPFGIRCQQGSDFVEQYQLAIAGQRQLADEGGKPLHTGIQPDHRPAIVALHRQRHARLSGGEEEIGVGHYDARAPARLLVPATVARIEAVVRHGPPLQQSQPLVEIEELSPALTQALYQQVAPGRGAVKQSLGPLGQLAHQEEVAVLVTGIDGTIAGAVGQHLGQLGQVAEAGFQAGHGGQLATAQQAERHASRALVQLDGKRELFPVLLEALSLVRQPLLHALLKLQHDEGAPQHGEQQNEEGGNVHVKGFAAEACFCHGPILVLRAHPAMIC
ncbi:hypothetical protein D3C79_564720 [compost metagenome]